MKQKHYFIGDIQFNSKKKCEDYTRNIINNLGCCKIDTNHEYFNFFLNLIKNHPEYHDKIGTGIDYFYIMPNPLVSKYFQTMIKRTDGTDIDFSWVYCCKFKERTSKEDLLRSLRAAIKGIVIDFKQKQGKMICNYCKNENELYENYHVDHDNPSFDTLKNNFLQSTTKQIPSSFGNCEKYQLTIFNPEDEDFKNEWIEYHNKYCNFQILCRNCNAAKGNK